ncbi:MAG: beta-ketoacyl-[acyl-carrier-protein] synthase I [SAR116 cluster bacterium]|nr:beta-ketoacyl-[acyl-carrier-protein] synthase I [SAR116 cluster bacterium]
MEKLKRVVVTGLGIVSPIGNNQEEVKDSLMNSKSGIVFSEQYKEMGFRSQVHGAVNIEFENYLEKKDLRFMGEGSAYTAIAMKEAINDANLSDELISNVNTGLIAGSGGPSTANLLNAFDIARNKGPKRVGPFMVPRCMSSTVSACLSTMFKIKGLNFSITSACSTSSHCIGIASDNIKYGKQNIVFAGGGEELDWTLSVLFDAMGAMSSKYNDKPNISSRPYDLNRDGFVIAGGGGIVVLEELEHALKRGAKIYGEIIGHAANSDGYDMVAPSGEGAVRCMKQALSGVERQIDYINSHGTSTPVGDIQEIEAIKEVFEGKKLPTITSTKSLTGHSLGATGVHEAIYTLIMMNNNFITGSANIFDPDPAIENIDIPRISKKNINLDTALSNSFGFGGTNACLVLSKFSENLK